MVLVIYCAVSIAIGVVCTLLVLNNNFSGNMIVDQINAEKDIFRLEFDINPADIPNKKYLLLRVINIK